MLRLLIAEDDPDIRRGLKGSINWAESGFELCGEAANGRQAVELTKQLSPDLILMDILMPEMNGLEALQLINELPDPPAVIVLSGHDQFSYAKQAMQLGTLDFLPKPYLISDLRSALEKARHIILARHSIRERFSGMQSRLDRGKPYVVAKLLGDLIEGKPVAWKELFEEYDITLGCRQVAIVALRRDFKDRASGRPFSSKALEVVNHQMSTIGQSETFLHAEYIITILEISADEELLRKKMHSAVMSIKTQLEASRESIISMGMSNSSSSPEQWPEAYRQAKTALEASFAYGVGSGFFYRDIEPLLSMPWRYPYDQQSLILKGIRTGDRSMLDKGLEGFLDELQKIAIHPQAVVSVTFSLWFSLYDLVKVNNIDGSTVFGADMERFSRMQQLNSVNELCDEIRVLAEEVAQLFERKSTYSLIVKESITYIRENYKKDIGLVSIAFAVHVTPSYLSTLFKQETGVNLNHYICKIRIAAACVLLKNPQFKIYEVALSVGFNDEKYFFAMFKKHMGMTPQHYRRLLG